AQGRADALRSDLSRVQPGAARPAGAAHHRQGVSLHQAAGPGGPRGAGRTGGSQLGGQPLRLTEPGRFRHSACRAFLSGIRCIHYRPEVRATRGPRTGVCAGSARRMDMGPHPHGWWIVLHIVLFVFWLGGDLGVFYSSRYVIDPALDPQARSTALRIMSGLDLAPKVCLVLFLPSGVTLMAA